MQQLRSAAIATMAAKARRVPERPPFECIALLLQGGGALNMRARRPRAARPSPAADGPSDRLRLLEERRQIRKARPRLAARERGALQVLHARHRLAGAAMGHDAGEALAPPVEGGELRAGRVVDDQLGFLHGMFTCFEVRKFKLCNV
jgi:hypothetical protein